MTQPKPYHRILGLLPLLALVLSLNQCSCSDTLGSLFVTEQDEATIGAQFDAELRAKPSEYPIYQANTAPKREFEAYVQGIFTKVLDNVPARQRPSYFGGFKLTIIDQPVVNAFAVPGGYIYLYTGIVDSMRDESELAGVLGHEVAHVTLHHYRDAMMQAAGISLLLDALAGNDQGAVKTVVKSLFGQLASLKVSRDNETEADTHGTRYIGSAGWDPYGIAGFFSRMPDAGIAWLSTHPAPTSRVEDVNKLVQKEGGSWSIGTTNAAAFLAQKANMRR
jgi:beta-barrel assembly-enhancing protease